MERLELRVVVRLEDVVEAREVELGDRDGEERVVEDVVERRVGHVGDEDGDAPGVKGFAEP